MLTEQHLLMQLQLQFHWHRHNRIHPSIHEPRNFYRTCVTRTVSLKHGNWQKNLSVRSPPRTSLPTTEDAFRNCRDDSVATIHHCTRRLRLPLVGAFSPPCGRRAHADPIGRCNSNLPRETANVSARIETRMMHLPSNDNAIKKNMNEICKSK